MGVAVLLIAYGGLMGMGGLMAFSRDKEKGRPALVIGEFAAIVLIFCGALAWMGFRFGAYAGLVMTLLLTALFALRYRRTKKIRPAGLMLVISLIVLAALGYLLFV